MNLTARHPAQSSDGRTEAGSTKPAKLLRLPLVEERTSLKKSTIYAGVANKTFPAPVRLSARAIAWREDDIDRWIAERTKVEGKA